MKYRRSSFAVSCFAAMLAWLPLVNAVAAHAVKPSPIDRHARLTPHNVVLPNADVSSPLSVGNGGFAFTVEMTELQTLDGNDKDTIPLSAMLQWGTALHAQSAWLLVGTIFTDYELSTTNGAHRFLLTGTMNSETIECVLAFSQSALPENFPKATSTKTAAAALPQWVI